MDQHLILTFMDGVETAARLARPFQPRENEIEVILDDQDLRLAYPLYDLCCIKLQDRLPAEIHIPQDQHPEEVETTIGETYHVKVTGQDDYPTGFFGLPLDAHCPYQGIFFTFHGVRRRSQPAAALHASQDISMDQHLEEPGLVPFAEQSSRHAVQPHRSSNALPPRSRGAAGITAIPKNIRVGDILVAADLVTREQVEEALSSQGNGKKQRIGSLLIEKGLISETQLLSALATKFGLRFVDLETIEPAPEALEALPREVAVRMQVLPLEIQGRILVVATSQPTDPTISENLRFLSSYHIELVVARSDQIAAALEGNYVKSETQVSELIGELAETATVENEDWEDSHYKESDSQIINLVNKILIDAYKKGASDIHFEPGLGKQALAVRYRVDGICQIVHKIAPAYRHAVIARLKIMARLDIAEHRRPQSGKIMLRYEGRKIEYRIEITPTVGANQDAVMRILSASKPLPLRQLGFNEKNLAVFETLLKKPYGIILCVGPTGSGKTTTLHSALGHINKPDRKIWTAEDPVEITQPGLRQVQVHPKIGFTFQEALRSFLRADPDVIMIGEMRDAETAKTAIEASLTGHLVFSTLHTNSAPETVVRLVEMGMDPYNFADAMLGIIAQRLARRLCDQCRAPYHPSRQEYDALVHAYGRDWFDAHGMPSYSDDLTLMRPVGCRACNQSGYRGRIAIQELLVGSEAIKNAIKRNLVAENLRDLAISEGMTTLRMDGIEKVFCGHTDLEQVLRVCL